MPKVENRNIIKPGLQVGWFITASTIEEAQEIYSNHCIGGCLIFKNGCDGMIASTLSARLNLTGAKDPDTGQEMDLNQKIESAKCDPEYNVI